MKKFVSTILAFVSVFSCLFGFSSLTVDAETTDSSLITEQHATYIDGNKYSKAQIASHFDVGTFADFEIVEDGGTHIDGTGNQVYSNYVVFGVQLNFDPQTQYIGSSSVKVSYDKCDWNETPYAASGDTEHPIAYGAISAIRTDAKGNIFKYEPLFSRGNTSVENMIFNIDGDYTVFVLFETVKNGKYQNHVLSWSFKVRSYIYVVDQQTGYPIKESGISNKPAVLDYAGRKNVEVSCTCNGDNITVSDGFVLEAKGQDIDAYQFTVTCNGFICEVFDFYIDSKNPTSKIMFANLRRQVGAYHYEAEEFFYLTWTDSEINPLSVTYKYYDYNIDYGHPNIPDPEELPYVQELYLTDVGLYYIKATTRTEEKIEYWVEVVAGDAPSYNKEALSSERFNNFKTKWYEVYDDINDRYLCFDVDEYDRAYDAAMTIENSSVNASSGKFFYNGNCYSERVELTAAMNEYVFANNIKLVYFDPTNYSENESSERTFSSTAFDGTRYLNDTFQFVNSHESETKTVVATDKDGNTKELDYFTPISEQNLIDGEYIITETDKYGHSTSYTAYRDKSAPTVVILLEESTKTANSGGKYYCNNHFSISEFKDAFDNFAVLKITKSDSTVSYYYQNEYAGIVFDQKGLYRISAYDRNSNTMNFSVEVN